MYAVFIGGGRCPGLVGPGKHESTKKIKICWVGHNTKFSTVGGPWPAGPPASAAYGRFYIN